MTAYQSLRLHPHAPRDLIAEVYWVLVTREKRLSLRPATAERRIGELNAAYELLIDDERRHAYDGQVPPESAGQAPNPPRARRRFRLFGHADVPSSTADHYETLCVDRDADDEIIDLAYAYLTRAHSSSLSEHRTAREQIDRAYRTLRHPQLRERYDATPHASGVDAVQNGAGYAETPHGVPSHLEDTARGPSQTEPKTEAQANRSPIRAMMNALRQVSPPVAAPQVAESEWIPVSGTLTSDASQPTKLVEDLCEPGLDGRSATDPDVRARAEKPAAESTEVQRPNPLPEMIPAAAPLAPPVDVPAIVPMREAVPAPIPVSDGEPAPTTELFAAPELTKRISIRERFFSRRPHTEERNQSEQRNGAAHASALVQSPAEMQAAAQAVPVPAEEKAHPLRRTTSAGPQANVSAPAQFGTGGGPAPALKHGRKAEREHALDAAQARLRTLRNGDDTPADESATAAGEDDTPKMQLLFIDGPQAGQRVPLSDRTVVFGSAGSEADVILSGDDPGVVQEHGRIWKHGDGFTFRQTWGGHTLVNGEPLALPLVRLDAGDEIRIGAHRLRFERI
jgi:curved DNA-binding protein CbpA